MKILLISFAIIYNNFKNMFVFFLLTKIDLNIISFNEKKIFLIDFYSLNNYF